jgi:hypothetical protein
MEDAVSEDARAQAATALQPVFSSGPKGRVQPVTRFALLHAGEFHALNLELNANQRIQIHTGDQNISTGASRLGLGKVQFTAELVQDFQREKSDLAFVILFEVEESVAADATASHALDLVHLYHWILAGRLSVMAKEVVT